MTLGKQAPTGKSKCIRREGVPLLKLAMHYDFSPIETIGLCLAHSLYLLKATSPTLRRSPEELSVGPNGICCHMRSNTLRQRLREDNCTKHCKRSIRLTSSSAYGGPLKFSHHCYMFEISLICRQISLLPRKISLFQFLGKSRLKHL